jgi:hypothetical protein
MTDRYVVVPSLNLPHIPCATEEEALEKSLELIQKRGRQLELEIRRNDVTLYDKATMRKKIIGWTAEQ